MKYTKIVIEYDEFPSKFNRTILVKGNPDLFKLASFFAYVLNTQFCHCYYFETESTEFVMSPFMEERGFKYSKYLANYNLSDLPNKFTFAYDTGSNYKFNCTIISKVDYDSKKGFVLLEANGQGVWEDNHRALHALLSNKIGPNYKEDDTYYLPWNFQNETFGDFFKPIDVDKINETLCSNFSRVLSQLRQGEDEYIMQNNVSLEDMEPDYQKIKIFENLRKKFTK